MAAIAELLEPGTVVGVDTVFMGPWIGEFGHEVMFAGMARATAQAYRSVMVCSRPGSAALYADFATKFVPHDIICEGMCAGSTAATRVSPKEMARWVPSAADHFPGLEYRSRRPARWHRYGRIRKGCEGAVVIHARQRPHVNMRNWSQRNWNKLARLIFKEGIAKRIICIGTREHALMVEGAVDARHHPLAVQMDILASAKLAVGPSSGPMHLASYCGCPHLVWCGGGPQERRCTRARYLREWNLLVPKTPVHAHEYASWQPTLETVWAWLQAFVGELAG